MRGSQWPFGAFFVRIVDGHGGDELPSVRVLFEEYAASLDVDLAFQDFDRELRELPGDYAPPAGRVRLAIDDEPAGCVALRPYEPDVCELKRLYVRPAYRGTGLGRLLTESIIDAGRDVGYSRMRLDTLRSMTSARALYRSLGFREIEAYRPNPVHGTTYFELEL